MDINNISLGRIFHKNNEDKSIENKKQSKPIHLPVKSENSSHVSKAGNSAIAAYAAALLALGGGVTSCIETDSHSESIVNVDLEEFRQMFQELLDFQKLILAQLQQNSTDNKEMIKILKEQNKVLQDIYTGVIDIKEGVDKLYVLALQGNEHDKEYIKKLDQIIAGQDKDNKKLQEILEESQKQTAWMANIGPYIEQIKEINASTGDTLNKFFEAYKKGDVAHSEFNQKLLDAVLNNGNISKEILEEIKGFRADCEAGRITEAELLAKIIEKLASIDGKMDIVIDKLNNINENIIDFKNKSDENHEESMEKLGDIAVKIENGFTINSSEMKQLIELGKEGNKNTTQVLVEMSNLKDILLQIKDKDGNLKIEELLTKYGDIMGANFLEVINILKEGQDKDIKNTTDIINAVNNSKPDLSKLQEQMGTIIVLLGKAQESGISPADLLPIVEGLKNLQNSNEAGNVETNKNLGQLIADMAEIKGMMGVVVETMGEMLKNQVKYGNAAEVSAEAVADGMKQILNGQLTEEKMDALLSKHRTDLTQVEASQAQSIQLLQAILDAQGQGSTGLTPDELDKVINNNATFNSIKDLLADLNVDRVTNTTLNNALSVNKTDLSKLQEQMGTVIILLQNSQSGNVTVDTSKLEASISELVSVINNQGVTSNTAMKDISDKLQNMIDMLKPEEPTPETKAVRMPQTRGNYQASIAQFQKAYDDLVATGRLEA